MEIDPTSPPGQDLPPAQLEGGALAYWVHKANGTLDEVSDDATFADWMAYAEANGGEPALPLDWQTCGPIIEREKIAIYPGDRDAKTWDASIGAWMSHDLIAGWPSATGPTPLVAAMRCFVMAAAIRADTKREPETTAK